MKSNISFINRLSVVESKLSEHFSIKPTSGSYYFFSSRKFQPFFFEEMQDKCLVYEFIVFLRRIFILTSDFKTSYIIFFSFLSLIYSFSFYSYITEFRLNFLFFIFEYLNWTKNMKLDIKFPNKRKKMLKTLMSQLI